MRWSPVQAPWRFGMPGNSEGRNKAHYCRGKKKNGLPCRAYRMKVSDYCPAHDETNRDENDTRLRANSSAAAEKSKKVRERNRARKLKEHVTHDVNFLKVVPEIKTQEDLREYGQEIMPLILDGKVHPSRANAWCRIYETMQRSFEKGGIMLPQLPLGEVEEIEYPEGHPLAGSKGDMGEFQKGEAATLQQDKIPDLLPEELHLDDVSREGKNEGEPEGPEVPDPPVG